MKRVNYLFAAGVAIMALCIGSCSGTGLRSSTVKGFGPFTTNVPYVKTVDYYGFVDPSIRPDGQKNGKDAFYLYFWVPAVIDEVGVAMISPAKGSPGSGDFKHPRFDDLYGGDRGSFFDTYIFLERMDIINAASIKNGGRAISLLDSNDDSSELQANPSGSRYNSLLRVKSEVASPTKALVRGVYRITFTSYRGAIKGSYIATVGTNIPGVKIAASLNDLHNLVNAESK